MGRRDFFGVNALMLAVLATVGLSYGSSAQGPSFTQDQANAGRQAYRQHCAVCHGARLEGLQLSPSLRGARFDQTFRGKPLDILAFHVRRMPPEAHVAETGSQPSGDDYANILAYLLLSNEFEASDTELSLDSEILSGITIPRKEGAEYDPDAPVVAPGESELLNTLSPVTNEKLLNPPPGDWLLVGRTYDAHGFSPLKAINRDNAGNLKPAWRAPLRNGSNMATMLVHQGVMYLHTFPDTILALDATNGKVLWRHQYETTASSQKMGLGLHGGKVYAPTSNLHLIALDAKTGELIWDSEVVTAERGMRGGYQLRSAPFIVGDTVIQGVTASFVPKGGMIVGFDRETGEKRWQFNTIARPGEPFGDTWNDIPLEKRSGGSVWHQGSYDPDLNLVYYGVAPTYDTGPLVHPVDKAGVSSEALYTNCTLAIDPATGDLVWHYQHVPNDQWDLDWVFERQLVTLPFEGEERKIVMNMGKMAILEALDARTGEYLFSIDAGIQNVITAIDPETGEKSIDMDKWPDPERPCDVCPSAFGARAWPQTSYNSETKTLYAPLTEWCMTLGKEGARLLTSGVGISGAAHPDTKDGMLGRLQAYDVANQKLAWHHDLKTPLSTAALATAGGVVFCGDLTPSLKAFDDRTGDLLWEAGLDDLPTSNLITYSVDDKQYIAVVVGFTNFHIRTLTDAYNEFLADADEPMHNPPKAGAAIWVFSL